MTATASLSDGSAIDVTYLAAWDSSDETVATINSWGTVSAQALGNTTITASVGTLQSAPWPLAVVERPALRRIDVQNNSCIRPIMTMNGGDPDSRVGGAGQDRYAACAELQPGGAGGQHAAVRGVR